MQNFGTIGTIQLPLMLIHFCWSQIGGEPIGSERNANSPHQIQGQPCNVGMASQGTQNGKKEEFLESTMLMLMGAKGGKVVLIK